MPEIIPANGELQVLISSSVASVHSTTIQPPYAVIVPDPNSWNDYGRGYFADLWLFGAGGETVEIHIRLMFVGFNRTKKALDELLEKYPDPFPIEQVTIPFVSLLPNEADYQTIIAMFGFDNAIPALRKLHDAVVLRLEHSNQSLVELTYSEEFGVGVLRAHGAMRALRRGGRFFRRDVPTQVFDAAAAGPFVFGTRLIAAENDLEVRFDFTQQGVFRDRIGVIIGRNGVGKTQLLKSLIDALASRQPPSQHSDQNQLPPVSRILVFSSVPTDPFPKSIGAWEGVDYEYFPVNTGSRDLKNDALLTALVDCIFDNSAARFGAQAQQNRLDIMKSVLDPLGLWARLCLPIRKVESADDLPGTLNVDDALYFSIHTKLNELDNLRASQRIDWDRSPVVLDSAVKVRALSSGEYAMLRFAAQATASIENGSLLLLDEPETHLHPNFVSELMNVLYRLLLATNSIAIIATHSAYVVREVTRESVKVMSLKDRIISVDTPRVQTFGASIDTLSQFVFGDTDTHHYFQEFLAAWAQEVGQQMSLDDIISEYGKSLNPESLSYVARVIRAGRAP